MTANEVVIVVKSRSDVRAGFEGARKSAENAGQDAGETYTDKFVDTVAVRMREKIAAPLSRIGDDMGKQLGQGAATGMAQVIAKGVAGIPEQTQAETEASGGRMGETFGESTGRTFVQRFTDHIRSFAARIRGDSEKAGQSVGDDIVRGMNERLKNSTTKTNTNNTNNGARSGGLTDDGSDRDSGLLRRWFTKGVESAQSFANGFADKISTFFSGDFVTILIKSVAVGGLAAALAPVLMAAISTAVLLAVGGGVIGAGIAAAFKDPRIQGAAKELGDKLGKMFEKFGEPFRLPVAKVLEYFGGFLDRISPKMAALGESMAPLVDKLGIGFIDMLEKALPGIIKAAEASKPLFETLAKHAPTIGEAIGKFFSIIAEQGDDAALFFDDLLAFIEVLLPLLARVIAGFTKLYNYVSEFVHGAIRFFSDLKDSVEGFGTGAKKVFLGFVLYAIDQLGRLLAGAAVALGWIPGIGGKLKAAESKFNEFRKGVNNELAKIKDKEVTIRLKTFGLVAANAAVSVAQTLRSLGYAHGGIVGASANGGGWGGGLTLVGENGPELAEVKPGGRVHSAQDTQRMLAAAGGGGGADVVTARWVDSGNEIMDVLAKYIRIDVQRNGNGNVQATYGQGR